MALGVRVAVMTSSSSAVWSGIIRTVFSFAVLSSRMTEETGAKPIYVTVIFTAFFSGKSNVKMPSASVTTDLVPSATETRAPASGLPVSSRTLPANVPARTVRGDRSPTIDNDMCLRLPAIMLTSWERRMSKSWASASRRTGGCNQVRACSRRACPELFRSKPCRRLSCR